MSSPSPQKNPSIGAVAYSKSNMMFIAKASTGNEASTSSTAGCASFSNKNRWAFLVVDYESSSEIRKDAKDEEEILKKLQDEYGVKLEKAITNADVKRKEDIKDFSVVDDGKIITLKSSLCAVTNSLKSLLETFNMRSQVKSLKPEHKEDGALHTRMILPLDVKECTTYLQKEQDLKSQKLSPRSRSRMHPKKHHAYAVVAWAYSYKEDKEGNLSLIKAKEAQVGFVPRARVECGLFFDGTNNNKFNTKMRQEYEAFLETKKAIIKTGQAVNGTWEQGIIDKLPKSKVLPLIYKDLSNSISSYTEAEKEDEYESAWSWIFRNKTSQDSEKIYDYFHDNDNDEIGKFVEDNLLPSGADSSYTGGNTNVVKLHKLYRTDVSDVKHDEHLYECYRDKIYVTGAGTYDHRNTGEHEEDEVFRGSALAMFATGVTAKVNQACKHLAKKLDALPVGYIDTLVLDVFGFSRGAAEARHFVGSICDCDFDIKTKSLVDKEGKEYKEFILSKNGKNLYPYLIREKEDRKGDVVIDKIIFRFVGIFDTVPHYGLFQDDDGEELNLKLDPSKISRVVHLTAKDEFRKNFDLYSIKSSKSASLEKNFLEKEMFGAHSDVGGGYIDGKDELVELAVRVKYSKKDNQDIHITRLVKRWNRDNFWVKNPIFVFIKDENEIHKKDGFYIVKSTITNATNENKIFVYRIMMYRKHIDNEYSQVSLEYMYKQSLKIVPLKRELTKLRYKEMEPFKNQAVADKFVWATENMTEDDFNPYKSQFIHHSSSLGIAHGPNSGTDNILYGKRTIHYV